MARSADGQRLVEQAGLVASQDSQPKVVVLARRHVFVEAAYLVEQFAS